MASQVDSREQLAAQTCSDSKWRHILVQVLVRVCLDCFHLVLLVTMLVTLYKAHHKSLENKVPPVNSNNGTARIANKQDKSL